MLEVFFKKVILATIFLSVVLVLNANHFLAAGESAPAEQLDFAHGLFQRGFYKMAMTEYKKFIELYPESENLDEAYFGIAESLFFSNGFKEAVQAYKRYNELFPDGKKLSISNLRSGQSLFLMKRYDEALQHFNEVESDDLEDAFVQTLYFYTGKAHQAKGDRIKALEYFKKAISVSKDSEHVAHANIEIGDIFVEDAETGKAIEYYTKAYDSADSENMKSLALYKQAEAQFSSGNFSVSADMFKKILVEYPAREISGDALVNLLFCLFNMSEYEKLITEYSNNEKRIPEDSAFFNAYYIAACAYSELARHDESLSLLNKTLSFSSLRAADRRKALLKKSDVLLSAKHFDEVVDLIERELEDSKNDTDYVIFLKAEAYYGLGSFGKSFDLYKKITDEFPASPLSDDALFGMAYARNSDDKNEEALNLFVEYYEKGKDDTKRQESLYNTILISAKLDLKERAIEYCEVYLATFKEGHFNEAVLFRLGLLHSELKNHEKSIAAFGQFIGQFGESEKLEEAHFLLAYNLQLSGDADEALRYYQMISQDKDETKVYYPALKNIAMIYVNKKDDAKAAEVFDRVITEFEKNDLGVETYLWLARHYLTDGKFDNALRVLQKAESRQDFPGVMDEIAYFKAEAHREKLDFEAAIKNYDVVLSATEKDTYRGASHIGKGLCLLEMGDFDKSKAELETAILENPEDNTVTMRAKFELANIERLKGNLEEASKLYMLVAILYRDDRYCPEALFRAGELFEAAEKKAEAIKVYREIVGTYEKSNLFEKAKERIETLGEN